MKTLLTRQSAFSRNQLWSLLFEAEMLFKIPMTRGDPKSTCEAQRLFGMRHPNSTCEEAERLFKNPITPANANCNSEAHRLFGNKPMSAVFFSFTS